MCHCDTETGCSKPKEVKNAVGAVLNMFCDRLNAREHENSSKAHGIGNDGKHAKTYQMRSRTRLVLFSILEPAQKFGRWRSSWTVAQVFHSRRTGPSDSVVTVGTRTFKPSYRTASGHQLPAVGSEVPVVELKNGDNMSMTFAVMDVTAPLAAVSRMVKAGHTMVLSPNACKHQRA